MASGCERQGYEDDYKPGTCEELLKWKFAHLNSVDFLLRSTAAGTARSAVLGILLAWWVVCAEGSVETTGPELYLLETRRDRTRGLTLLQGPCRPLFFLRERARHCEFQLPGTGV